MVFLCRDFHVFQGSLRNCRSPICILRVAALCEASLLSCGYRPLEVKRNGISNQVGLKELCRLGRLDKALELLNLSVQGRNTPHINDFYYLLQGCYFKKDLTRGREVNFLIVESQLDSNAYLGTHLIRLFEACRSLHEAKQVFKRLPKPDVFAWTAIISAHAKLGECDVAVDLYHQMQSCGTKPDKYAFVAVLKACACISSSKEGNIIHSHVIEGGFESDLFVSSILIDMYSSCGSLSDVLQVVNALENKDIVVWNAMIGGYAEHGHGEKVLWLFMQMLQEGVDPNDVSFLSALKACSMLNMVVEGVHLHVLIIQSGFLCNSSIRNALVDMYAKCGCLEYARLFFEKLPSQDVVAWNTIISGYIKKNRMQEALVLFHRMRKEGIEPSNMTWNMIIAGHLESGKYKEALWLFDAMQREGFTPDIVTWNTLLDGLCLSGFYEDALWLLQQMLKAGQAPSVATFVSALKACTNISATHEGQVAHCYVVECRLESNVIVSGSLIDMYANCGCLEDALLVFNRVPVLNVVVWSALIAGFVQNGCFDAALHIFKVMQQEGYEPNEVTFVSILSACCHGGLVDEGYSYFELMQGCYGIKPTLQHYNCLVELLSGAGYVAEAQRVLLSIPFQANILGWTSLLSSCRRHRDVPIAKQCFEMAISIDCRHAAFYVIMSDIYSDAGMMEEALQVLALKQQHNNSQSSLERAPPNIWK